MSSVAARRRVAIAVELERPAGQLEAEGDRLGVDRVRAAHHHRLRVLARRRDERAIRRVQLRRAAARPAARHCSASAVSTTSLLVSPKWIQRPLGPDGLGDLADEGDDVVIGGLARARRCAPRRRGRAARRLRRRPAGTMPRASSASSTAISTRSICSKCAWSRPQRAHLRAACSAGSSGVAPTAAVTRRGRRCRARSCMPGKVMRSAAA